jgi:hypothetical protein
VPLLLFSPPCFPFLVHPSVSRDDRHLFAHAVASDLTETWQMECYRHRSDLDEEACGVHEDVEVGDEEDDLLVGNVDYRLDAAVVVRVRGLRLLLDSCEAPLLQN